MLLVVHMPLPPSQEGALQLTSSPNPSQSYRLISAEDHDAKLEIVSRLVSGISQHASSEERTLYPLIQHKVCQPGVALGGKNLQLQMGLCRRLHE